MATELVKDSLRITHVWTADTTKMKLLELRCKVAFEKKGGEVFENAGNRDKKPIGIEEALKFKIEIEKLIKLERRMIQK